MDGKCDILVAFNPTLSSQVYELVELYLTMKYPVCELYMRDLSNVLTDSSKIWAERICHLR